MAARPFVVASKDYAPALNIVGEHYRQLAESDAFLLADDFDELVGCIERCIVRPGELAGERARIAREVVGEIDGRAGDRVVRAIVETFDRGPLATVP